MQSKHSEGNNKDMSRNHWNRRKKTTEKSRKTKVGFYKKSKVTNLLPDWAKKNTEENDRNQEWKREHYHQLYIL